MKKNMKYTRWIFINLVLPFFPLYVRLFINIFGIENSYPSANFFLIPDILFISTYLCIVILNINIDGEKTNFEIIIRYFVKFIILFNCFTLGLLFSNNTNPKIVFYNFSILIIPTCIAPLYKFKYRKS